MSDAPRTIADLDHDELALLANEHLLCGHLIDRAGMPLVIPHGLDVMTAVAIEEWRGASPVYAKRMQQVLGFEGDTVETVFKGMQLDIGAPPEFMDFRYTVTDDGHGEFHLDHCGALMDVEPMGDDFVVAMCHHIEDPTFDATGWASNPRVRMRPVHRPPRAPADRHPHCSWTVDIDPETEPTPEPEQVGRIRRTLASQVPLADPTDAAAGDTTNGITAYDEPLDPDLHLRHFATSALRAIIDEVCLQGHLLSLSFGMVLGDKVGVDAAMEATAKQFTGVAGVAAERLRSAFGLTSTAVDIATAFALHPAFHPADYVDWSVTVDDDVVRLELGDCPAAREEGVGSWITLLADGHDQALSAIAAGVDPHWRVRPDGNRSWVVERTDEPAKELDAVTLTKFSTGATFQLTR